MSKVNGLDLVKPTLVCAVCARLSKRIHALHRNSPAQPHNQFSLVASQYAELLDAYNEVQPRGRERKANV
jgi:hypothetical protein